MSHKIRYLFVIVSSLLSFSACKPQEIQCTSNAWPSPLPSTCIGLVSSQWKTPGMMNLAISTLTERGYVRIYLQQQYTRQVMGRTYTENIILFRFDDEANREINFNVDGFLNGPEMPTILFFNSNGQVVEISASGLAPQLKNIAVDLSDLLAFIQQDPDKTSQIPQELAARIEDLTSNRMWDLYDNPELKQ